MHRAIAAVSLLVLATSPARALDCKNPVTTADMITCAGQEFAAADKSLNAAYKDVVALMQKRAAAWPKGASALRDAQRAWVAFRDANCTWESGAMEGGSAQPVVEVRCQTRMTQARTRELQEAARTFD